MSLKKKTAFWVRVHARHRHACWLLAAGIFHSGRGLAPTTHNHTHRALLSLSDTRARGTQTEPACDDTHSHDKHSHSPLSGPIHPRAQLPRLLLSLPPPSISEYTVQRATSLKPRSNTLKPQKGNLADTARPQVGLKLGLVSFAVVEEAGVAVHLTCARAGVGGANRHRHGRKHPGGRDIEHETRDRETERYPASVADDGPGSHSTESSWP